MRWGVVRAWLDVATTRSVAALPADRRKGLNDALAAQAKVVELAQKGKYEEAMKEGRRSAAVVEKPLGEELADAASALSNVGYLLQELGRYEEARGAYERTLSLRRKLHPPDHPELATSFNILGAVQYAQAEYATARVSFIRALAIRRKALGEHPALAVSFNNLGVLSQEL